MDLAATFPDALILALPLALLLAAVGLARGWLSRGGAAAAVVVGSAVFMSGWPLTITLLFFFFSARGLDRILEHLDDGGSLVEEQRRPRSAFQVVAVGAVPAAAACAFAFCGAPGLKWAAFAALAFATADTWATNIGMSAAQPPRLMGLGRPVPRGRSGGMTPRGTLGSLLGALSVGLFAAADGGGARTEVLLLVAALGFTGGLVDSLLGATLQCRYECIACGQFSEQSRHCGRLTRRQGGILSNSGVNLVVSVLVGACGYALAAR